MGKAYIDTVELGVFSPQQQYATGYAYTDSVVIGDFNFLTVSGKVYVNGVEVGTYSGLVAGLPIVGFIQPPVINPTVIR